MPLAITKIITKLSPLEILIVFNIIQEICNNAGYYEYSLGYFEKEEYGGDFIEVFSWTSVSVADSIFGNFQ